MIRDFRPSDYGRYSRIHDALFPSHPLCLEGVKYEDSCYGRTRYKMRRYVVESESGQVVAVGEYAHLFFSYHPRRFSLTILVHPDWQRQGIGGMMHDHLASELSSIGAEITWVDVLSGCNMGQRFVAKRGYVQRRAAFESELDLTSLDLGRLEPLIRRLKEGGVIISDLATEMVHDGEAGRKLFDLEGSARRDVPNIVEPREMSYHDYQVIILANPFFLWEGSFVAKHGDQYVGSSTLLKSGRDEMLDQGFTAVRPGFRGRGIAQAVKLHLARHAGDAGARLLRTRNDSRNTPMLAVNRKLGFVERDEWITCERSLYRRGE